MEALGDSYHRRPAEASGGGAKTGFVIVTISRDYGAGGLAVSDGVAQALGYELLADGLSKTVAARMGLPVEVVASHASAGKSLPERMLGDLGAANPEGIYAAPRLPDEFDEAVRREIERTLRERAAEGDVVILGRIASAVLAGMPGLLRVFLTGARQWRIERIMESVGRTASQAAADIDQLDAARRKFAKERYKVAWGDARSYDLVIDVSYFGIPGAVNLIVTAAREVEAR